MTNKSNNILSRNPTLDATTHDFNQTLRYQYITKKVKQLTKAKPNARILDVGAGRGTLTNYLTAKLNCITINLETGKQQKLKGLIVADGIHLPFIDGAFDVVISSDVLEHIDASKRGFFLIELLRCAKTGAILTYSKIHTQNPQKSAIRVFEKLTRLKPEWYTQHNSFDLIDNVEIIQDLRQNQANKVSIEPIVGFSAVASTGIVHNVPWRAHLRAIANIAAYFIVRLSDRPPYYGFGVTAIKNSQKAKAI